MLNGPEPAGSAPRGAALVTGASSGIGKALARALAAEGREVILTARSGDRLAALARECEERHGVPAWTVEADLARPDAGRELWVRVGERADAVDVLVNNAGIGTFGPFLETSLEETLRLLRLNVEAATALTRLALPAMRSRGRGAVLNVASTAAFQPGPLMSTYYASKAYLLHWSEALAEELRGTGVTVTCLCPGPTATEFHERAGMEDSRLLRLGMVMDADAVARAGLRALARGRRLAVPGLLNKLGTWGPRLLPRRLLPPLVRAVQRAPGRA